MTLSALWKCVNSTHLAQQACCEKKNCFQLFANTWWSASALHIHKAFSAMMIPFGCQFALWASLLIVDGADVSVISVCMSAWTLSKHICGDRRVGETKRGRRCAWWCFCVGDNPPGIPWERGLYSTQHKHSQRSMGGKHQSVSSRA